VAKTFEVGLALKEIAQIYPAPKQAAKAKQEVFVF
jgi:hypothetical protein